MRGSAQDPREPMPCRAGLLAPGRCSGSPATLLARCEDPVRRVLYREVGRGIRLQRRGQLRRLPVRYLPHRRPPVKRKGGVGGEVEARNHISLPVRGHDAVLPVQFHRVHVSVDVHS